jgi:hypothetical protein
MQCEQRGERVCLLRGEQCVEQEAGRTQCRRLIARQKRPAAGRVRVPERHDPVVRTAGGVRAPRVGLADEARHQGGVDGRVDCCWPLGSKDRIEQMEPVRRQKQSPDQDRPEEAKAGRDEQRAGEEVGQMRRPCGSVVCLPAESLRRRSRALPRGLRSSLQKRIPPVGMPLLSRHVQWGSTSVVARRAVVGQGETTMRLGRYWGGR